jgi:uncharacterized membrane protein
MKTDRKITENILLVFILMISTLLSCKNDKDQIKCSEYFFEMVGDLDRGSFWSEANDISADGLRVVGSSYTDDITINIDGDLGYSPHPGMAIGWTRPCDKKNFFFDIKSGGQSVPPGNSGGGILGLGYYIDQYLIYTESLAYGISPDGKTTVGFINYKDNREDRTPLKSTAAIYKSGQVIKLLKPNDDHSSAARDASNKFPGKLNPLADLRTNGNDIKSFDGIIVGWSGSYNHPARSPNGRAVYWDPYLSIHDLITPQTLPNSEMVKSAEAVSVSDDGEVIIGNLYYQNNSVGKFLSFPCVWKFNSLTSEYELDTILDVTSDGFTESHAIRLSGNGKVIVGNVVKNDIYYACKWSYGTGMWGKADVLSLLNGMKQSTASGVSFDGKIIVGGCSRENLKDTLWGVEQIATLWDNVSINPITLEQLLKNSDPNIIFPSGYIMSASNVSANGKIITGNAFYSNRDSAQAWVAKIK